MKKILDNILTGFGFVLAALFIILFSAITLSILAALLILIGNLGRWYINLSLPVRVISSLIVVGSIYIIHLKVKGGWKGIFKSIINAYRNEREKNDFIS